MSENQETTLIKSNVGFSQEDHEKFKQYKILLKEEPNRTAKLAKALHEIKEKEYYLLDGHKTFEAFCKCYGCERSYCYRLIRYGELLMKENIPDELAPSETAVRPVLKNCFSGKEGKIFNMAKVHAKNKQKLKNIAAGVAEEINMDKVIPDTDDVRNAIRDFKLEENGTLYLTSIDITVPASTDFSKILEEYREKFKNVHTLLNCLEQYKKALPGKDLSLVREMVMLFIDTLHKQETAKAENLFSVKNDEEAENE